MMHRQCLGWVIWETVCGRHDTRDDLFNVKGSVCDIASQSVSCYGTCPVSVVSGHLPCECSECVHDLGHDKICE